MANRVTDDDVKAIIDTDLSDLTPFITAANLIIDNNLANEGMSSDLLKELERWLAAHLVAIRDPLLSRQKIGDAENVYQRGAVGSGLATTDYGKQVMLLDTSGILADLDKPSAELIALDLGTDDN